MDIGQDARDRLDALAGLLQRSRQEWYGVSGNRALWTPTDGSYAAREWQHIEKNESGSSGPWSAADAQLPLDVASLYGVAAAELVGGLAALYEAGEVVFSAAPLVRSVLEHYARAAWLLDIEIGPRQRVARAWLEILEGARQAKNTAARLGVSESARRARVYDELRTKARTAFSPGEVLESRASVTAIAGEKRLDQKKRLGRVKSIDGDTRSAGVLNYLANASHPTEYAIRELLLEVVDEDGSVTLRAGLTNPAYPEWLAAIAVLSLFDFARAISSYLDWPSHQLEDWYQAIGAVLPDSAPSRES
jgi:hypothetical protein